MKKLHIQNWSKPCIYVSNQDPRLYSGVDVDWLNGNCIFVELDKPLFTPRQMSDRSGIDDLDLMLSSIPSEEEF